MHEKKTYLNWSSGKDAAMALHILQQDSNYKVNHLLTAINSHFDRVSMHGLRRELLELQFQSLGLPYSYLELPEQPDMQEYETRLNQKVLELKNQGFTHAAYGDIFLEDLRTYREEQLKKSKMNTSFPLWGKDTTSLIANFLELGFKAIIIATKSEVLDQSFVGRLLDQSLIEDLPSGVDPCGENGEFHTFCFDGPIFQNPIKFKKGEKIFKEYKSPKSDSIHGNSKPMGFWFCDLLPD